MAEESIDTFLAGLQGRLLHAASKSADVKVEQIDPGLLLATTFAPNPVIWATSPDYLGVESLYAHVRQYQIMRDLFQTRCPLAYCNNQSSEYIDCWGKGREYLESENLLIWSDKHNDDVCPHCGTTRAEFIQDGLLKSYNQMHLVCGMRCIPGNTRIVTDKGMMRIDSIATNNVPDTFVAIDGVNVLGINGYEPASDLYYAGSANTVNICTSLGIKISGSTVHPVMAIKNSTSGWYKLSELSVGDKIHVASNNWPNIRSRLPISTSIVSDSKSRMNYESSYKIPEVWSNELAQILGYLVAEGQCNRKYGVRFTNGDIDTLKHFDHLCIDVFGYSPRNYSNGITVDLNGIGIRTLLSGLGLGMVNAHNKSIPESIWLTSREHAAAYLSAYFEGDGTASIDNTGKPVVACYSVSEKLAYDTQQMLWALGVKCSVTKTKSKSFRSVHKFDHYSYSVRIYGRQILNFSRYIGFISTRKKEALQKCVDAVDVNKCARDNDYVTIKSIKMSEDKVDLYDLHVPGTHSFSTGIVLNHNSGKTSVSAVIGSYIEHVLTVLGHRHNGLDKYFKQLPGQKFDITFVASTDIQSKDTIWAKFTELRRNSIWYNKYTRWIKQQEVDQKTPNGVKPLTYEELDKEIKNDFINLKLSSLNSNSGGMAGRTRAGSFIDELARFEVSESARSADEVYRVLDNSLASVRGAIVKYNLPHKWLGMMASISSPISIEDKSMTLLRQCPHIDNMYYGHYATWDFNPELPRSSFDSVFQRDPIGAMRDYGASPPNAASPLITDPISFRAVSTDKNLKPTVTFRQLVHVDRIGREYTSLVIDNAQLVRDGERYMSFDAGATFDQFAGACAHGEWVTTPEGRQLVTVYDWIIRVLPEAKPRRDVWFDFVVQMVEHLRKYCTIARIEFDRWQSTYLIQQIRDRGINCEMKGTTYDHFCKFVNDANFSKVRMLPPADNDFQLDPPAMTSAGLAFYELERLERDMEGKKVWNPRKGQRRGWNSDDVATVVAHVNDMVQSSVIDISDSTSRKAKLHREQSGSTSWSDRGAIYRPMLNRRGW